MVKSISFSEDGKGYLYEKYEKPEGKPRKSDPRYISYDHDSIDSKGYLKRIFLEDKYNKDLETYNKRLEIYKKHAGEYLLKCSRYLVGKKFEFGPKINIIFGPNGIGKTTILRSIAGNALIHDGFTKLITSRIDFNVEGKSIFRDKCNIDDYITSLPSTIRKNYTQVDSSIEWEGNPIYYHNFEYTLAQGAGMIGMISGNEILSGIEDELSYSLGMRSASLGGKSIFFIQKLINIAKINTSLAKLCESTIKEYQDYKDDDERKSMILAQVNYLRQFPLYAKESPITLLVDEIDKSLDIRNVASLYLNLLPQLQEKTGIQIIAVSHSPWVLCDAVYKNPAYNIISIDEEYTKEIRELLKTMTIEGD